MKHPVYDSDTQFIIDPVTRSLKNAETSKAGVIQFDHNSERVSFLLQRTIEGHDMSLCDSVRVHYINIDAITKAQTAGVYEVTDLRVSPDRDDMVVCSWLISQNATQYVGSLNFVIRFACTEPDGTLSYVWSSAIYKGISVWEGIDNGEAVVDVYPDILENWRKEVFADIKDDLSEHTDAAIAEIRAAGDELIGGYDSLVHRVAQNSKRISNLEQGITPDPFVTDDTVAYQKAVPSGALPFAALERLGGMSYKSNNLAATVDGTYVILDTRVSATFERGSMTLTLANYGRVECGAQHYHPYTSIFLRAGTYTLQYTATNGMPLTMTNVTIQLKNMSTNTNIISENISSSGNTKTFTIGTDAELAWGIYLWNATGTVCDAFETTIKVMINEGSTALPFEPYLEGVCHTPVTAIECAGKNLWDEIAEIGDIASSNGLNANTQKNVLRSTNYIGIPPNESLFLGIGESGQMFVFFYDAEKNYISSGGAWKDSGSIIKTPASAYFMRFQLHATYGTVYKNDVIIAASNEYVEYEPHGTYEYKIPEEIRALYGYGLGISDDCYNYIDFVEPQYIQMCAERAYQSGDEDTPELITDGIKTVYPLDTPVVTELPIVDNFFEVCGCGTLTFVNEQELATPSTIVYCIKE